MSTDRTPHELLGRPRWRLIGRQAVKTRKRKRKTQKSQKSYRKKEKHNQKSKEKNMEQIAM